MTPGALAILGFLGISTAHAQGSELASDLTTKFEQLARATKFYDAESIALEIALRLSQDIGLPGYLVADEIMEAWSIYRQALRAAAIRNGGGNSSSGPLHSDWGPDRPPEGVGTEYIPCYND